MSTASKKDFLTMTYVVTVTYVRIRITEGGVVKGVRARARARARVKTGSLGRGV